MYDWTLSGARQGGTRKSFGCTFSSDSGCVLQAASFTTLEYFVGAGKTHAPATSLFLLVSAVLCLSATASSQLYQQLRCATCLRMHSIGARVAVRHLNDMLSTQLPGRATIPAALMHAFALLLAGAGRWRLLQLLAVAQICRLVRIAAKAASCRDEGTCCSRSCTLAVRR